jgi:post-segregation antitoxin (ccd killing protein)
MKNITVTVDEETYRRARVRAAEQGTSVSRVVKEELTRYAAAPTDHEQWVAGLKELYARVDESMKGKTPEPVDPDWRQKMYDERFDESKLGRRMRGEDV